MKLAHLLLALVMLVPVAAAAADESGGNSHFYWEWANLLLLVAVLTYLARKPVLNYLADRRRRIQDELASSEKLLTEAEARLAEWSAKAARLDADVAEIQRLARQRSEAERVRILADAELSAERTRRDAVASIEREVQRARRTLREEAADLAIQLAEQHLKQQVSDADRDRLVDEFVSRVQPGDTPEAA